MATLLTRPVTLITVQLLAFWPVWQWYLRRMLDTSDEPYGFVALVTAAGFVLFGRWKPMPAMENRDLLIPALLTAMYAATYRAAPMIVSAGIAMTAVAALIGICTSNRTLRPGLWLLLLLALPVMASLQFYAGFPLRTVVGKAAVALLQLSGLPVVLDGTLLCWNGHAVGIDTPCSGIKMLWAGFYMTAIMSCFFRWRPGRSLLFCLITLMVVILGNTLRATALFFVESGMIALPAWTHQGIGLCVFILMMLAIAGLGIKHDRVGPPSEKPCGS
ncbi:MAG: archaeosortase/exosortase family protein [Desulfobacteraceae bacterium]|jgi:exosortase